MCRKLDNENYAEILRLVFDKICNKENWKLAVHAEIPIELAPVARAAVMFMTGSAASAHGVMNSGFVTIQAPGYYAAQNADLKQN